MVSDEFDRKIFPKETVVTFTLSRVNYLDLFGDRLRVLNCRKGVDLPNLTDKLFQARSPITYFDLLLTRALLHKLVQLKASLQTMAGFTITMCLGQLKSCPIRA